MTAQRNTRIVGSLFAAAVLFVTLAPSVRADENGGETKAISTSVSGIEVSENFPYVAKVMHEAAIIRSMTSKEGSHPRVISMAASAAGTSPPETRDALDESGSQYPEPYGAKSWEDVLAA